MPFAIYDIIFFTFLSSALTNLCFHLFFCSFCSFKYICIYMYLCGIQYKYSLLLCVYIYIDIYICVYICMYKLNRFDDGTQSSLALTAAFQ